MQIPERNTVPFIDQTVPRLFWLHLPISESLALFHGLAYGLGAFAWKTSRSLEGLATIYDAVASFNVAMASRPRPSFRRT